MSFTPTPEQQAAVDAFNTRGDMILEAGAGAGKTSTLKLLAASQPRRRGIYLAFNKAIAREAQAEFPQTVQCATVHAMAMRAVGRNYSHRLNGPRVPAWQTAKALGILGPHRIGGTDRAPLAPAQIARLVIATVKKFCYSGNLEPLPRHVPQVNGLDDDDARDQLAHLLLPLARKAWADITSLNGRLRFEHDHYLKMWQLTGPRLDADYVLLDEAQDTNGVVAALFDQQTHAKRVAVGDSNQSIYGWRGAVDAIAAMAEHAAHHLYLTTSFRFGQPVADEANKWLQVLDSQLRITGAGGPSRIEDDSPAAPDAILTRTNATAMAELMTAHRNGVQAALVGGGKELRQFAEAAKQLQDTGQTWHPELMAFTSWGMVQDYVEQEDDAADLKVFVQLIDEHTPDVIINTIDRSADERRASLLISTAHKAKGREWGHVRVASDFGRSDRKGDDDQGVSRADAMLAYVTVTRARKVLDRGGLGWVDDYLAELTPAQPEQVPVAPQPVTERVGTELQREAATMPPAGWSRPGWVTIGKSAVLDG